MSKSRFEAFSDSVFAFALTLLVLGIVLPSLSHPTESELTTALLHLWPNVIAYALSFAVIGIMWQNHQALFRLVERIDRKTVFLNLLLLAATAFIPFVTGMLGAYPTMHASTFSYGVVLSTCSIVYNLLLMHLVRARALHHDVDTVTITRTIHAYRVGLVTYVAAMFVALVYPIASFIAYVAIALYYLVPRGLDADIDVQTS